MHSFTGLRPLGRELCSDNGHFPLVWDDSVALGVPPYIQNQPSGHMGLDMGSHYPPRAPLYSHTGLRPLCCELCSDNGHFPPVWAYQAGLIIYMHMPHIQKRTGGV